MTSQRLLHCTLSLRVCARVYLTQMYFGEHEAEEARKTSYLYPLIQRVLALWLRPEPQVITVSSYSYTSAHASSEAIGQDSNLQIPLKTLYFYVVHDRPQPQNKTERTPSP